MTFPELDILHSLIRKIFRIESFTLGDTRRGYHIRYAGVLHAPDSALAYDQLAAALSPYGLVPLFELIDGKQYITLVR